MGKSIKQASVTVLICLVLAMPARTEAVIQRMVTTTCGYVLGALVVGGAKITYGAARWTLGKKWGRRIVGAAALGASIWGYTAYNEDYPAGPMAVHPITRTVTPDIPTEFQVERMLRPLTWPPGTDTARVEAENLSYGRVEAVSANTWEYRGPGGEEIATAVRTTGENANEYDIEIRVGEEVLAIVHQRVEEDSEGNACIRFYLQDVDGRPLSFSTRTLLGEDGLVSRVLGTGPTVTFLTDAGWKLAEFHQEGWSIENKWNGRILRMGSVDSRVWIMLGVHLSNTDFAG